MKAKFPFAAALAAAALLAAPLAAQADEADLAKGAGCMACHAKDKKLVGPSFNDISAKYKGKDAVAQLTDKVRKGGAGNWGQIPMPPHPVAKIGDAELKSVVTWILKG